MHPDVERMLVPVAIRACPERLHEVRRPEGLASASSTCMLRSHAYTSISMPSKATSSARASTARRSGASSITSGLVLFKWV